MRTRRPASLAFTRFALPGVLLAVAFCSALHAVAKPFWYDEICTVIVCRLPGAGAIWKALDGALDGNPPVFYLAARAARGLVGDDHLGYRLISIVGLLLSLGCVYLILRRRVEELPAMAGAGFLLCTVLSEYAYEARPYASMVGLIALAVLAWQRLEDSRYYVVVLAVALAGAESLHYYAIFAWPAFAVGEATVFVARRRFRVGAWIAIILGATPLLIFGRLLVHLREYAGKHFWAHPSTSQYLLIYDWLFNAGGLLGLSLAIGLSGMMLYPAVRRRLRRETGAAGVFPIEEQLLTVMLLWLPLLAITAAIAGHAGMANRYMMAAVLGGALAVGQLLAGAPAGASALLLVVVLANYGLNSAGVARRFVKGSLMAEREAGIQHIEDLVEQNRARNMPIVISSPLEYLPMAYYAPAAARSSLYVLIDPQAAVKFEGADSLDLALLLQRRYFPLQAEEYSAFAAKHREFLLVSEGGMDWWPQRLARDGETVRLLSDVNRSRVYDVALTAR